jgi:hypothetical protein
VTKEKRAVGVVVDWETSGLREQKVPTMNYLEGPQGIELGATLVWLPEVEVISTYSSRVRFLGVHNAVEYGGPAYNGITWNEDAERFHGIKIRDLINERMPSVVAAEFATWVKTNAGIDDPQKTPVMFCGHNPEGDMYYTRQLMFFGGIENAIRFHYRMIDSFSLGYFVLDVKSSNELFERVSGVTRKIHTALEDSMLTTQALKTIYKLCQGNRQ